jgi:Holliday junction resolvase RusA-like endonuclease
MVGEFLMGMTPKRPLDRVRVVFTRFSSVEPDDDGLVHGFKPIRDALVQWGVVVDDKRKNLAAEYRWEKAPPKHGKVRVEIEELPVDTVTSGSGSNLRNE